MVKPNATVYDPEVACTENIYSGGGFSNYFAIPDYQKDVVDHYLKEYYPDCPSDLWNSTGTVCFPFSSAYKIDANRSSQSRALPDISANGANYVTAVCSTGLVFSLCTQSLFSIHRWMVVSGASLERRPLLRSLARSSR